MSVMPIPRDPERRKQLWLRLREAHPQMAAEIEAARKASPEIKLTSFTLDGVEYRSEPAPTNVHAYDMDFIRNRLPAKERAQLFLRYGIGTEHERRLAQELLFPKAKKGKRK